LKADVHRRVSVVNGEPLRKMKLLLNSLLLASLCALSSWSHLRQIVICDIGHINKTDLTLFIGVSSSGALVTQTPDLSVMEGETVNITCCITGAFDRAIVKWLKNQTTIKKVFINESQGSLRKEMSDCLNLTFTNITREDSGRYTCMVTVEIPTYNNVKGNGTVITVTTVSSRDNPNEKTAGEGQDNRTTTPIIISLAVVAPLLLVALACFCALRRRQAQAARVIYEVPHIDSEEADMDKHSTTSSRGSSQWCQVPVYESFDYFERVETKESG
ncbi:hypothetical protein L3Q82_017058, partial [Scortum barcoo]